MWVVTICYSKVVQITFHIDANIGSRLLAYRNYNSNAWQPWVDINVGFGFSDVWKKGTSTNALLVDLNNPNGENNKTTFVANWNSGTTNLPSDCACGVREVSWVTGPIVMVRITGWTVNTDIPATWVNAYVNGKWLGWSRAEVAPIVLWSGTGAFDAPTLTLNKNIGFFKYYEIIYEVENGNNGKGLALRRTTSAPSGTSLKLNSGGYWSAMNTSSAPYSGACCPRRIIGYV